MNRQCNVLCVKMSTPYNTPSKITAGDTLEWAISLAEYPSPGWVLSYALVKTGTKISFSGSQYGTSQDHHILVAKATSAAWLAGKYSYQASVTDGTTRKIIENGTIEIIPDFAQASTGYDDRTFAKRSLDNIEAVIENRATQAQQEYAIAGRQLKFIAPTDLLFLRDRFLAEYRAQERSKRSKISGSSRFGQVQTYFSGTLQGVGAFGRSLND